MKKALCVVFPLVIIVLVLANIFFVIRLHEADKGTEKALSAMDNEVRVNFHDSLANVEDTIEHLDLLKNNPDYFTDNYGSPESYLIDVVPDTILQLKRKIHLLVSYARVLYPDNTHLGYIPDFDSYAKAIAGTDENDSEKFEYMLEWTIYFFDILRDLYPETVESDNSFEAILKLFTNMESKRANLNNMFNDLYFGDSPGQ